MYNIAFVYVSCVYGLYDMIFLSVSVLCETWIEIRGLFSVEILRVIK